MADADPVFSGTDVDWREVARLVLTSRAMDRLEEEELVPAKKVLYQFSARGHDMAQVLLGLKLKAGDAACGYYRSRPLLLALGVPLADALGSGMGRAGGYSGGRDIGVVFNYPNPGGAHALPMSGGVGAQYTPAAGWAHAIKYKAEVLKGEGAGNVDGSIAVVLGGDASCATGGFWSALTIATTQQLPLLIYVEDNGYGISVPSTYQTPGQDIAANLGSFRGLTIFNGDGTDPVEAARLVDAAVAHVRGQRGPALLRLTVPRLEGHSYQDTQTYKSEAEIAAEWTRDPLPKLKAYCAERQIGELDWSEIESRVEWDVAQARDEAEARPVLPVEQVADDVFFAGRHSVVGGRAGLSLEGTHDEPRPEGQRINMVTAIRRVLEQELAANPRMCVFGEDVGPKGGVHAVTLGLQERFGVERVFDTSLNEEGIVGRAAGMAMAGLLPVPEIQFRKYAESATEQINDIGTMRWRTANRYSAPMVLRVPGGFFKCGDPWHSQTNEVQFVHNPGWLVAVPSNAEDAVGLLRSALRGNDPVLFFEHRAMLDDSWARRPWPGDGYVLPFGRARKTREGDRITIVTWGAMVPRCEAAAEGVSADVIDLRTLMPWDREVVLESVRRTRRCLIVHEDLRTGGFGAEIAAVVADEAFLDLDAPVARVTMPDIPSPHHPSLLEAAVPSVGRIRAEIERLVGF